MEDIPRVLPRALNGNQEFSKWESTSEGINIRGGFALWNGHAVIIKKCQSKADALRGMHADKLLDYFPPLKSIGSWVAEIEFREPVLIRRPAGLGRGDVTLSGRDWYLIQKRLPADCPSWHRYVVSRHQHNPEDTKLWLPTLLEDPQMLKRFTEAFLYRMVIGAPDPGPTNFMVDMVDSRVYPVDIIGCMSPKMRPGSDKPWLTANLAGKRGLGQLRQMSAFVKETAERWRREIQLPLLEKQCTEKMADYAWRNLQTLERDFQLMVDRSHGDPTAGEEKSSKKSRLTVEDKK